MKLGGEYRHPERDNTQWEARKVFLRTLEETVPEAVHRLWHEVMPVCVYVWAKTPRTHWTGSWDPFPTPVNVRGSPRGQRRGQRQIFPRDRWEDPGAPPPPLRDALLVWAGRFNLEASWILNTVLQTLLNWLHGDRTGRRELSEEGDAAEDGEDDILGYLPGLFADPERPETLDQPPFSVDGWDPYGEQVGPFRDRVLRALEAYILERRPREGSAGDLPTRAFRKSRHGEPLERNLQWFVLYQVRGLSFKAVAEGCRVGRPGYEPSDHSGRAAVTRGIKAAGELIGLRLRPPGKNQYG